MDKWNRISLFLENIEKTSESIQSVMEKKERNLLQSIDNFEQASLQINRITRNLDEFVEKLELGNLARDGKEAIRNIGQRFSDEELGNVVREIDDFVKSANSTLRKLDQIFVNQQEEMNKSLEKLSETIENLSTFSRSLVEDPTILIRKRVSKRRKK